MFGLVEAKREKERKRENVLFLKTKKWNTDTKMPGKYIYLNQMSMGIKEQYLAAIYDIISQ